MSARVFVLIVLFVAPLMLLACEDTENCMCSPDKIDPPISDLSVLWEKGNMFADLMPIVPPDPIACRAWLIFENKNPRQAFSKLEIPTAKVILVKTDSILGAITMETDWDGILAPGLKDTVLFFKTTGTQPIFDPPCNEQVLIEFVIHNADGETKVFMSDTLVVGCVY